MDLATILGIVSAFGLVIIAIVMGGGIGLFINIPSLMIVVGGTLGATMINYPLKDVLKAVSIVKNAFFASNSAPEDIVKQFTSKVPLGRLAEVEDVVAITVFLASKGAGYMTGQAINITGGREMH